MIIRQFNLVYFSLILIMALAIILLSIIYKGKTQRQKDLFIIVIGIFNIVFFIIYKICLYFDDYEFVIWDELPLQLCNINMFIIPIAVMLKNKYLLSFGFYVAPLAAIMAITFPELDFTNNSIFLMRNIGFYGTHMIIVIIGILLVTFGYLKPNIKDIGYLVIPTIILSLCAFLINILLFKVTGFETNYFFTMNTANISLLNIFYNLIPIKYLYLLPAMGILIAYVLIINGCFKLFKKNKYKENL